MVRNNTRSNLCDCHMPLADLEQKKSVQILSKGNIGEKSYWWENTERCLHDPFGKALLERVHSIGSENTVKPTYYYRRGLVHSSQDFPKI